MKKVATRTLASIAAISSTSTHRMSVAVADQRIIRALERIYRRHDRKFEIRAALLGVSPLDLRNQMRTMSFDSIVRRYGFRDIETFYIALTGKIKDELRRRGWSEKQLNGMIKKRLNRVQPMAI